MITFTGDQLRAAVDELQLASWPALECTACSKRSGFVFHTDGTIAEVGGCSCHGDDQLGERPCEWSDLAALINGADDRTRQRWAAMFGLDAGLEDEEVPGGDGDGRPIVWAKCEGTLADNQCWAAYSSDGQLIGQHVSSDAWWGQRDVGPGAFPQRDARYLAVVGTADPKKIDYRVVPIGADVPSAVRRAIVRRRASERAQ